MIPSDPEDFVDVEGILLPRPRAQQKADAGDRGGSTPSIRGEPWKMVWFTCCHVYGRIFRNKERTRYLGRCPKCGAAVEATIAPGGTTKRLFRAE